VQSVGRYQIESEIGRGAMGVVYRAHDPALGRTVAIKTIHLTDVTDEASRQRTTERLLREAQAAGTLSHPHIVTVFDVLQQDEFAYIVMEFVPGSSLEEVLGRGTVLDRNELLLYVRQVAEALDYAHRKGIIHRDIKPANILIAASSADAERSAKITDFGIAKSISHDATQSVALTGTPSYMAPEQIEGTMVDGRADQFSLAVVIYELLTGKKPFEGDTLPALLRKICFEEPIPVEQVNANLSRTIGKVLMRALAKRPESRFASVSDFAGALSIALAEGAPAATKTTAIDPALFESEPKPARNTRRLALVVFLCFVVAAAIVFIARLNSGSPVPVQVLETRSAPVTPAPQDRAAPKSTPAAPPPEAAKAAAPPGGKDSTTATSTTATSTAPRAGAPAASKGEPRSSPNLARGVIVPSIPPAQLGTSTADVDLISQPAGAQIVVDGRGDATCHAPCTMALVTGRHTLTAQMNGYATARRIFVLPETRTLYIPLSASSGALVLTSIPPGASVSVDGRNMGRTPITLHLTPGVHDILLVNGSQQHQERVNIEAETFQARSIRW
jgi:tRNA A-37 threonylcarbamoyl transferase component Bud32